MQNYDEMSDDELLALYHQQTVGQKAAEAGAVTRARKTADMEVKRDFGRLEEAREGMMVGRDLSGTADELDRLLSRSPTGVMAPLQKFIGKATPWGRETAADLKSFERQATGLTLEKAQGLKGALSDKDLAFLKSMAPDVTDPSEVNQAAIDAYEWAGNRLTNYEAGLQVWNDKLGSPAAKNRDGKTYDQWFGEWAAVNLPRSAFYGSKSKPAVPKKKAVAAAPATAKRVPAVAAKPPVTAGNGWKIVGQE